MLICVCNVDLSTVSVLVAADDSSPNIALARHGYLGTAPLHPKTAVTFRALEAYRQLHRVCPKLSIYAQVQVFCHLHEVRQLVDSAIAQIADFSSFGRGSNPLTVLLYLSSPQLSMFIWKCSIALICA